MSKFYVEIHDPELRYEQLSWALRALDSEHGVLPEGVRTALADANASRQDCRNHHIAVHLMEDRLTLSNEDSEDASLPVLAVVLQGVLRENGSQACVTVEATDPNEACFVTANEISFLSPSDWLRDKEEEHISRMSAIHGSGPEM